MARGPESNKDVRVRKQRKVGELYPISQHEKSGSESYGNHPFEDLLYWRYPGRTFAVIVILYLEIYYLAYNSFITVAAYTGLAVLTVNVLLGAMYWLYAMFPGSNCDKHFYEKWLAKTDLIPQNEISKYVMMMYDAFDRVRQSTQYQKIFFSKLFFASWSLLIIGRWMYMDTMAYAGIAILFTLPVCWQEYSACAKGWIDKTFGLPKSVATDAITNKK